MGPAPAPADDPGDMKALGSALALLLLATTTIACGGEGSDDPASGTTQALVPAAPAAVDQPLPNDLGTPPGTSVAPIPLSAPAFQDPFAIDSADATTPHADPCVQATSPVPSPALAAVRAQARAGELTARLEQPACPR
jgi:hypothetical protein